MLSVVRNEAFVITLQLTKWKRVAIGTCMSRELGSRPAAESEAEHDVLPKLSLNNTGELL